MTDATTAADWPLDPVAGASSTDTVHDVVVVGSGPAGYTAAIYLARAQLRPLVFEGAVTAGGALMNTTEVENFPGFVDGVMGPELMQNMRAQAERFGTAFVTDDVTAIDFAGDVRTITTGSSGVFKARSIVLAMGSGYRELGLPNEKALSGRGVSWCATCDGFFFRGKTIAVVGGGDSAMEEATFLTRFAEKVYVIHRRDHLRASKIMVERAENDPKIEFVWNCAVTALHGESALESVELTDTVDGSTRTLALDGLFIAIGHDPRSEVVRGTIECDEAGYVVTKHGTHTNIDGVFACGDLVDHTYRQAITAAGSGCAAALDAERWLATQG